MKVNLVYKLFGFMAILLCSNSCFSENPRVGFVPDREIVMTINKEDISAGQFKKAFDGQRKIFKVQNAQELKPEELIWIKNRVLDEIVKNTLLSQEIKKSNISVDKDVLKEALKEAKEGYPEGAFEKTLEMEGITIEEWENSIRAMLLVNKLIHLQVNSRVSVEEKELRAYFDGNHKKFHKKEQVKALHIMVETEDEIRDIQKELQRKQKSFSELAKEFSLGPEGAQGGDLGYFEAGQMPEEFDGVFELKIGKISGIIKTPYGFHLLKVVDKIEERKMSFEESRSRVEKILLQDLQNKVFQEWFLKLKKNSRIEVDYESLQKIF